MLGVPFYWAYGSLLLLFFAVFPASSTLLSSASLPATTLFPVRLAVAWAAVERS